MFKASHNNIQVYNIEDIQRFQSIFPSKRFRIDYNIAMETCCEKKAIIKDKLLSGIKHNITIIENGL